MCRDAAETFLQLLRQIAPQLETLLNTPSGDWAALGVIDIRHTVYPLSQDTKLTSKIIELMILPILNDFASKQHYSFQIAPEQNYYPDVTFIDPSGCKFALDIKTTYRVPNKPTEVSAMTLGSFTGYFRERNSTKNILYPYSAYSGHFVLGVIYTRADTKARITHPLPLEEAGLTPTVIRDLKVFVQHKYRIANDRPGSGNTKNIGSVRQVERLLAGAGPFAPYGEEVFDDYWMNYQTREMAGGKQPPYTNLQEYFKWREEKR